MPHQFRFRDSLLDKDDYGSEADLYNPRPHLHGLVLHNYPDRRYLNGEQNYVVSLSSVALEGNMPMNLALQSTFSITKTSPLGHMAIMLDSFTLDEPQTSIVVLVTRFNAVLLCLSIIPYRKRTNLVN
ncbi:hypothetical protein BBP40_005299 [Aspergillus hancockii]|nr:hypothetical protein BBP40_005299 [Aspergillus hancockii]